MQIYKTIPEFLAWRKPCQGTLGFVPTMGALHEGHLSLVQSSRQNCNYTVVSIYVNPAQFSPTEDLDAYPRQLESDLEKLGHYSVDAVFVPDTEQMYPPGFSTAISEDDLSLKQEGASRPTHFQGVTTIVGKLFNIVEPTHAFFGEKDAQQLRIIRKMVHDLNYPVKVIACPTARESHGLAMSSRNEYLTPGEREKAAVINRALKTAEKSLNHGERSAKGIREMIRSIIENEPLARIDYISVADDFSLSEIEDQINVPVLVSLAVFFGKTRLIDNFSWHPE